VRAPGDPERERFQQRLLAGVPIEPAVLAELERISGDQYPDRNTAQDAALPLIAESLHAVIRDLLVRGVLVEIDGKIIPNPTIKP
jgi:hypothetical protein